MLVEVQDPAPGRAGFIIAVTRGEGHREPGHVGPLDHTVFDQPGQDPQADAVGGTAAGPAVDPPAGADRVAVARLEVGAADRPAHERSMRPLTAAASLRSASEITRST